ncbi:hypothetical protein BDZ97DRAFT_1917502 [Flammula alnicola]|nr:hypothetical protein BDZ97DRAFT_1917502 [Flammula alnicola]
MAAISADSDHSTTISSCSLIGTTLARLKDATLQFDADYLRPGASHSIGLDVIRQLAADAWLFTFLRNMSPHVPTYISYYRRLRSPNKSFLLFVFPEIAYLIISVDHPRPYSTFQSWNIQRCLLLQPSDLSYSFLDALAGALYFSEYTLEQSPLNINDFACEVFRAGLLCEPILILHLTPDPDARFLDLLKQLVHLQNVARQLANAALFNKLHRFLVHHYVRLLGLSKDEIADFYAEGVLRHRPYALRGSYPDIMQKVKLLDVIRGAPGATLANYAQPLEETAYLMSKWSSHTSTVASNPGTAQAVTHVANIFVELQDTHKPYKLSEKAAAVCALHLSIQPRALKGDIPTGPKAAVATSSSKRFTRGSRGKGATDDFETASAPSASSIDLNDFLRIFKQMKVDGDRIVFSDTATDPGTSPSKVAEDRERPNSRKRRSPPSAEPSAKFSAKCAEVVRLPYALVPNMDVDSLAYLKASKALAHSSDKSPARSDSDSSKRAHTEDSYVFGDSAVLVEASDLAVNNAHSQEVLAKASALVSHKISSSGDELAHRKVIGEIQAELVVGLHCIEFHLQHCELLLKELKGLVATTFMIKYRQVPADLCV